MADQSQTYRIGVSGMRRGRSLALACQTVGGAEVTALFDPDADRLQASAAEIGATPYTDFDAFLASGIDVAIISSPMPVHAEQSIAALRAGKHVLCEVLACVTVAEARELVAVAKESPGRYMLAENVNYYDEIELIKRLADQGRFGHIYYGEGDYTHSLQGLFFNPDGSPTWRGLGGLTVYGSHGLGPLLYITGDRVAQVRATSLPGAIVDPLLTIPLMHLLDMTTDGGRVFRTRVDPVSFRPHESTTFFVVQGTHASYESIRGFGDRGKIWFRDQDEPVWYDTTGNVARHRRAHPPRAPRSSERSRDLRRSWHQRVLAPEILLRRPPHRRRHAHRPPPRPRHHPPLHPRLRVCRPRRRSARSSQLPRLVALSVGLPIWLEVAGAFSATPGSGRTHFQRLS